MEIISRKPKRKNKVDSQLVLALKAKKQKSVKKRALSLKALTSKSDFISSSRLTSRIGFFCKGKSSTRVQRQSNDSPLTKARAEQNLLKVLELMSRKKDKSRVNTQDSVASRKECSTRNSSVPTLHNKSSPERSSVAQWLHNQSFIFRSDGSSSTASPSDQRVLDSEVMGLLFHTLSNKLELEVKENHLLYWDEASYLRAKKILSPKPGVGTPPSSLLLESPAKENLPVPVTKSVGSNTDNFVLDICPELKQKVQYPQALDVLDDSDEPFSVCFQNNGDNTFRQTHTRSLQQLLGEDIVAWEPDNILPYKHDKSISNTYQSSPLCNKLLASRTNDIVFQDESILKTYPLPPPSDELLTSRANDVLCRDFSPMKPPLDVIETPKLFYRRKMF